jgi:hypothetical protein
MLCNERPKRDDFCRQAKVDFSGVAASSHIFKAWNH